MSCEHYPLSMSHLVGVLLLLVACTPRVAIRREVLATIDPRLFGSFLERYGTKEPGPEAARTPGTRRLRPEIMAAIRAQAPKLLRFPGGTLVDYGDWQDLISKVTDQDAPRPRTELWSMRFGNEFGLDEFLGLCEEIDCQPLLVVKLLSALTGTEGVESVAAQAAAMVAYCNGRVGQDLPNDLERWPELRQVNGRTEPWNVRLWQIGNETWAQVEGNGPVKRSENGAAYPEPLATRYREALLAVAAAMRAVDPDLVLITDGPRSRQEQVLLRAVADPAVRKTIDLLSNHAYAPGPADRSWHPEPGFDDVDHWRLWVAMPGLFDEQGFNTARSEQYRLFEELGYPSAVTEWNWNGYAIRALEPHAGFDIAQAAGIGAAGFLHGLIRECGRVRLANQSLLLACRREDPAAIAYDDLGERPPRHRPTGLPTVLMRRHHGVRLLKVEAAGIPTYAQPLAVGWARPVARVALLDVLATADDDVVFIHVINRSYDQDLSLAIDLKGFVPISDLAHRITWQASLAQPAPEVLDLETAFVETPEPFASGDAVLFPARSVSVLRIPVKVP